MLMKSEDGNICRQPRGGKSQMFAINSELAKEAATNWLF